MNLDFALKAEQYYYAHFDELLFSHKFHFASRMFTWKADDRAAQLLQDLKEEYIHGADSASHLEQLRALLEKPQTGRRVAHELRLPYFAKYPDLYGVEHALFRVRHLLHFYGIDAREAFLQLYPLQQLNQLKRTLAQDPEALRVLSSYAVNMFYVSDLLFGTSDDSLSPKDWYEIGLGYSHSSPEDIQLFIYFYTHCIIGDTNFYAKPVTPAHLEIYTSMLQRLEAVISEHFKHISLDNKLEFLVAAQLCDYQVSIADSIYEEARNSMSSEGDFLIERHNTNLRPDRQTFQKSEHRTTLLIMSASKWQHARS